MVVIDFGFTVFTFFSESKFLNTLLNDKEHALRDQDLIAIYQTKLQFLNQGMMLLVLFIFLVPSIKLLVLKVRELEKKVELLEAKKK